MAATTNVTDGITTQNFLNQSEHYFETLPTQSLNVNQSAEEVDASASINTDYHLIIIYYVIGACGIFGNILVCIVMFSSATLRRKITNWFIINQSLVDFAVSFFLTVQADVQGEPPHSGIAGELYCRIWATKLFLWGFLVSSTYNLVALTIERYLAVVHPIWHKTSFSKTKATVLIALVWLFGPVWNASYMIVTSSNEDGVCAIYAIWPSITVRRFFGVLTVLLQYLIPLTFIIFAYGSIALKLYRKLKSDGAAKGKDETIQRGMRNTVKTLVLVAICFVACWSWNQIYYLMMNLGFREDYSSNFYHFTVIAVFINSCVNPMIYALKYDPFKKAAYQLFCTKMLGIRPNAIEDQSASHNTVETVS
uniref:Orphan G-protein coupled receptor 56 n=1 Tax=Platynereis dumerilii TaxID=6359 RepID=A0A0K0PVR0_PLADU|nr:orphan G-protein coupled receptor 56 [Platynereis dumerilii]